MLGVRPAISTLLTGALIVTLASLGPAAQVAFASTAEAPPVVDVEVPPAFEVPEAERDAALGSGWEQSDDQLWTTIGDPDGLNLMIADEAEGFAWRTLASLSVDGMETDRWIGNACLTADGSAFAVVYAPRSFTNDPVLMTHGAFASLVDAETGAQTFIGQGYSLAYFNPGCGVGNSVVLSQFSEESAESRLTLMSTANPAAAVATVVSTQLTSATADEQGIIAAAGGSIVRLDASGQMTTLASTTGSAYDLELDSNGGLGFVEQDGTTATAKRLELDAESADVAIEEIAVGPLQEVGLAHDQDGTVYLLETPPTQDLPEGWEELDTPIDTIVSTSGDALLVSFAEVGLSDGVTDPLAPSLAIDFSIELVDTGEEISTRGEVPAADPLAALSVAPGGSTNLSPYGAGSSTSPVEAERVCAVPRNDPANQALQPLPRQVEWAVDKGVKGLLTDSRPANFMGPGMASYSPQGMFPLTTLSGGGRIPAQVMLGILAQESNLWQASRYTTPGLTGNPLVGNYYGTDRTGDSGTPGWWTVNFDRADCGYGVAQITDGMRLAGREKPGEVALPYSQQRAIALDYQANVAKGLDMLAEKWNQTRDAGLTINDGDPKYLENWFFAIWAYNSGFYPDGPGPEPWGVGWLNNPINPIYDQSRGSFLNNSPSDAASPELWPYPEKVLGFAAHSVELQDSPTTAVMAFRTAWWTESDGIGGSYNRASVQPPIDTFCVPTINSCDTAFSQQPNDPESPPGPCLHQDLVLGHFDLKCWYHGNATWKSDCASECGREFIRFASDAPAEPNGTAFPPNCTRSGLPANALIIDNLPSTTPVVRQSTACTAKVTTTGSFSFTFQADGDGEFPSKIDLHQLGGGFNGQFYFTHARDEDQMFGKLGVTGVWNLGQSLDTWARVLVHTPDHGAWTQQAAYTVNTGANGSQTRTIAQRNYANEWVSLGVFDIDGIPTVSLSNTTYNELLSGRDDIAWDAIAIVPLAQKPTDFVVALGDSYSSGEGASDPSGSDYYRSSDNNGFVQTGVEPVFRNACHRSTEAWSRKASTASFPTTTIGARADSGAANLDYHLLACSGAEARHMLPFQTLAPGQVAPTDNLGRDGSDTQFGEVSQLDRGFLDANTTLVTLSIGGNDMRFADMVAICVLNPGYCPDSTLEKDTGSMAEVTLDRLDNDVFSAVVTVLQQIHIKAPNAQIVLMGYPKIFESNAGCVFVAEASRPWINLMNDHLNSVLGLAAADVGPYVSFADPTAAFSGHGLCTANAAINGLVFTQTEGDDPTKLKYPWPGEDGTIYPSAQSFHPNKVGTDIYATVLNDALSNTPPQTIAATLVPGAATTYYATYRFHSVGPAAFKMVTIPGCAGTTRIGLRMNDGSSPIGVQHTDTLIWTTTNTTQYFQWTGGSVPSYSLPTGSYAFNGRQVGGCGTTAQSWNGILNW